MQKLRTLTLLFAVSNVAVGVAVGAGCNNAPKNEPAKTAQPAKPTAARPGMPPVVDPIPPPPDVAAPPADAVKTKSGLATKVLVPGKGTDHPEEWDRVVAHYTGWTTDGKMFDSSVKRGQPATFPLKGIIPGWTEALQLMTTGEKRRLWIPEDLAYKGRPGRPQGMLVFDVELISIQRGTKPPPAPDDVAAPPKDAKKEASGLSTKLLQKGTGTKHPTPQNTVTVNYTGWTTDGKMFDSSVARGQPATFPLGGVIKGWTEGVGLMVEGEKRRLWIPEDLAYQGRPGPPKGMLVFDVELIKISDAPPPRMPMMMPKQPGAQGAAAVGAVPGGAGGAPKPAAPAPAATPAAGSTAR